MKNKIKKTTVNSLFNSIQFNSIQFLKLYLNRFKIFLIALLFILLFLISCKSKQNPTTKGGSHSKSELVGTWYFYRFNFSTNITIDNEGNINFPVKSYDFEYTYTGKLDDTFDYPYTVEINTKASFSDIRGTLPVQQIIFSNASNASANCGLVYGSGGYKWVTSGFCKTTKK